MFNEQYYQAKKEALQQEERKFIEKLLKTLYDLTNEHQEMIKRWNELLAQEKASNEEAEKPKKGGTK